MSYIVMIPKISIIATGVEIMKADKEEISIQ